MSFSATDAYQLSYWLDTQPSFPPTTAPSGWNLAFVPAFLDGNYAVILSSASDSSQLAVVIMGTHDAVQMLQDTDIGNPGPFLNSSGDAIITGAWVANGASAAFTEVLNLKHLFQKQTLGDYLTGLNWADFSVLVTGHSLGGTVASLLGPWLASVILDQTPLQVFLPPNMQVVTFAAFAAGNQEFADYLNGSTQYQPNINVNDIVPYVWATGGEYPVSNIYNTFVEPGPLMPSSLQGQLTTKVNTIPKSFSGYVQTNEPNTFTGAILAAPSFSECNLSAAKLQEAQWNWEVSLQHNYAYCVQYIGTGCLEPSSACPES
ncbi:MAG TPA: hypothetical protein VGJ21_15585 [Terracidiphilus sp.]|jgi:hypothetical protein